MEVAYTLCRHEETDEVHLFEGVMKPEGGCTAKRWSVCKKMEWSDRSHIVFKCKDEDEARGLSAIEGREVCGVCVSHLYTTYEEQA